MSDQLFTNRLANETSPYLLQHAHNPVDWYPWGSDAFEKAKREDKPIFLSIGYSACHWCHVMEHESFENEEIADFLNRNFVSIKVDREERPDVDSIYMQAVQIMTGHGGWPMSMFLTPDRVPFFGGTYFPPADRMGMPGFLRVLDHVSTFYRERRDDVMSAGVEILGAIRSSFELELKPSPATRESLDATASKIASSFDAMKGGFGGAPKFPPSMTLDFLAQVARRSGDEHLQHVVTFTLTKMAYGGIYDQIGGGFHRYSVDARWLVPHFEKMLYDNALLARLYVRAWQWTKDDLFRRTARETLGFITREMTSPDGGFYSTLDADSEGEEGKFYVWNRSDIIEELGAEQGRIFCALYDGSDRGNWEGKNILNVTREPESVAADLGITVEQLADIAARGKCHLFGKRSQRVRPGRDEKILAGWNGWMLAAFAEAAIAFDSDDYRNVVRANADFLMTKMLRDGKLYRSYKDGRARIEALLEDYAGVAWGLLGAFEATQDRRILDVARSLGEQIVERFADRSAGGFFDTPEGHEALITRPKDLFDNATPAGNSVAIEVLHKLAILFADEHFERAAASALDATMSVATRYPSGFGFLLSAAEAFVEGVREIVVTGPADARRELLKAAGEEFVPHRLLVTPDAGDLRLLDDRPADRTLAYVCKGYVCDEPADAPAKLREQLRQG